MDIIKAEDIIIAQFDQFFGYDGLIEGAYHTDLGLLFKVDIHVENFGYEKDGNTHHAEWDRDFFRQVEIVVTARHQVFVRVHQSVCSEDQDAEWVNTSNHDSCWRSDGLRMIWETVYEGWKHCWEHVPEEHRKSPDQMHRFCNVNSGPFSKGLVQFVRVKSEYTGSYQRKLTEIRPVKFAVTVEE